LEEHEAACRIEVINEGGGPGTAVRGGTGGGFTGDPAGEGNVGGEGSVGVGGFGPGTLANCCSGFDGGGGGGGGGYYGGGGGAGSRVEVSFASEGLVWTGGGGGGGGGSSLAPPGGTVEPAREDSQSVRISWSRGRHHRR